MNFIPNDTDGKVMCIILGVFVLLIIIGLCIGCATNHAPIIYAPDSINIKIGEKIKEKIYAIDPDQDNMTLIIENLPHEATFVIIKDEPGYIEGEIIWVPKEEGIYKSLIIASDGKED